jgi:TRAP-type C4-dicarboxylate transport system permease small subunit
MDQTLESIPPEAWPIIDLLFNITMAAAGIWLAVTAFVIWRRHASNLTPVNAAERNRKAQPDFLKVDQKAREEAIERGDAFEKVLDRRDAAEAKAASRLRPARKAQKIASFAALIMAIFSIMSVVTSSIFTVTNVGRLAGDFSTWDRAQEIIGAHPIAFTLCVLIILARIYTQFFRSEKKEG